MFLAPHSSHILPFITMVRSALAAIIACCLLLNCGEVESFFPTGYSVPSTVTSCVNVLLVGDVSPASLPRRKMVVALPMMSPNNGTGKQEEEEVPSFKQLLLDKPGTLIAIPFVLLLGADLLLNIFFLTKRTIEFFALGQAPSAEPWW